MLVYYVIVLKKISRQIYHYVWGSWSGNHCEGYPPPDTSTVHFECWTDNTVTPVCWDEQKYVCHHRSGEWDDCAYGENTCRAGWGEWSDWSSWGTGKSCSGGPSDYCKQESELRYRNA